MYETEQERVYRVSAGLYDLINDDDFMRFLKTLHTTLTDQDLEKVYDLLESYGDSLDDTSVLK